MDNYIDENIFIRSLASRGSKGGLSNNIDDIVNVLEFCGFDIILLETVGVGQIEVDVVEIAETVALILVPESGDDIQIMKAGLIEIADIFVINKSDREESDKIHLAIDNLKVYFDSIGEYSDSAKEEDTIKAQNYYCSNQTQNPHTPRVMKSLGLNEQDVEKFCTDILFPKIN